MASSWDSYYVVFLSAVLSLGIPGVLAVISHLFFTAQGKKIPHSRNVPEPASSHETVLGQRINVRFFLAANAALVLFGLALALLPCTTTLQATNHTGLLSGLVAIVTVAGFAILGLLYSVRKGDMSWVDSFHRLAGTRAPGAHEFREFREVKEAIERED